MQADFVNVGTKPLQIFVCVLSYSVAKYLQWSMRPRREGSLAGVRREGGREEGREGEQGRRGRKSDE